MAPPDGGATHLYSQPKGNNIMPEFRGSKNVHVGFPVWAASVYEHATRDYVITLDAAGAKKFRPLAEDYGFREVKSSNEPEKASDSEE